MGGPSGEAGTLRAPPEGPPDASCLHTAFRFPRKQPIFLQALHQRRNGDYL